MSRSAPSPLTVRCPDCDSILEIDGATGEVLAHRPATRDSAADFDQLLAGLDEGRARAERVFEQQVRSFEDRDRLMEEKFRRALERAESDDSAPAPRPWDLD